MIMLLSWAIFGLIVGVAAKALMPGKDPSGWLKTIGIGIFGSYIGGIFKYILIGGNEFSPAGLLFSLLGAVVLLFAWRNRKIFLS